jgi:hypothetical protein
VPEQHKYIYIYNKKATIICRFSIHFNFFSFKVVGVAQLINKNPDASAFTNEDQEVINIFDPVLLDL